MGVSYIGKIFHRAFVPSAANAYAPHVLGQRSLMALLAIMIAAEGFLVANMVSQQSGVAAVAALPYSAAAEQNAAAVQISQSFGNGVERQIVRALASPDTAAELFGAISFLILLELCIVFIVRMQKGLRPHKAAVSGLIVAALALGGVLINRSVAPSAGPASLVATPTGMYAVPAQR